MARLQCCLVLLALSTLASCNSWTGDYKPLGKACEPSKDNCFPGSACNADSKICDCSDSADGAWRRTFENKECRLMPGSQCARNVDQDFYRCVQGSKCTETRKGQDPSTCLADGPCDTGDHECICPEGKTCLTQKVAATPL